MPATAFVKELIEPCDLISAQCAPVAVINLRLGEFPLNGPLNLLVIKIASTEQWRDRVPQQGGRVGRDSDACSDLAPPDHHRSALPYQSNSQRAF